jgi:hypothetical protein
VQVLSPALAADPVARRGFMHAAAGIAQLSHAAILQVYDIGEDPAFAVFEHAAGGRLAERLRAGTLRQADAVRSALSIARALEALRERGQNHGALGPATVLFDSEGRAKILALGATGPVGPEGPSDQPPGYRPPEPDALPADRDRYALAALTFQMLTGSPPEPGARARRRLPAGIDSLLARALGPDPAARPSLDAFIGALAPFARVELTEARRGPRFSASEFNWLIPVILIVIVAVLAVTLGVSAVNNFRRDDRATPAPTTSLEPGAALDIETARDFDFETNGGNGEENPEDVERAIDGEPETYWGTVGYSSADLGGSKPGVGLLFDLGSAQTIARARVRTGLEGWSGQIRVADAFSEDVDNYRRVQRLTASTDTQVDLPPGTRARYVVLWITQLAEQGGKYPYGAEVSEVEFYAA